MCHNLISLHLFRRYNILNYQPQTGADGGTTYDYKTIGTWEAGVLNLDLNAIYWPQGPATNKGDLKGIVKSVCAEPCKWDQAQVTLCFMAGNNRQAERQTD